jgi:SAM-dependent methyltransferase
MAADRGVIVAGIDAALPLIQIAAERTPQGDFRVGDIEALPWPDASFDVVTGFNSFQFAQDKARALAEARRVSRGPVVVVIPVRAAESGVTQIYKPMLPLFPAQGLETMKQSGIFSLSEPGKLEETLADARLNIRDDEEVDCLIRFENVDAAVRAFVGAGPTGLAIQNAGEEAVTDTVRTALVQFTSDADGTVTLPGWYRIVIAGP